MLCIDHKTTDVYFNLASEEYLLKNSRESLFMLWQNEPSVIVGKHQDVFAEVNMDFAEENRLKIARRFSGGGAVYHDPGNLNLTFIETRAPVDFAVYSHRILRMLASLGIDSSTDQRRAILINGLKISGSAQSIHKDRVLYHATLLFSSDLKRLNASLESNPEQLRQNPGRKAAVRSVKSPVTNLSEHLPFPVDINEFKTLILDYFINESKENKPFAIPKDDLSRIEELRDRKYASKEWIFNTEVLKK